MTAEEKLLAQMDKAAVERARYCAAVQAGDKTARMTVRMDGSPAPEAPQARPSGVVRKQPGLDRVEAFRNRMGY